MFWGRIYEHWKLQCIYAILVSISPPNTTPSNTLYYVDYIAITMFTISRSKHRVYSFCTKISAFLSPINRTRNFPKFQIQKYNPFTYIHPASEAIMQKRKPLSNYHIMEIMCCLCIFYDRMINSGKRLLRSLFIRLLYWNSCYICIIYMALWK